MEQGGGAHDLQVGAFGKRQLLCQVIDAQHMVEAMHGVVYRIPATGGFDGGHR